MDLKRRSQLVYGLLAAVWVLVVVWQVEEHMRVREAARTDLRNRSKDIANTLSAFIRGLRFRGTGPVMQNQVESVLNELVNGRTNEIVKASELISIELLNAAGEPVAFAGKPIDFEHKEIMQEGERWGQRSVTLVNPVDLGASLASGGATNPTVVLPPPPAGMTNSGPRFSRREQRSEGAGGSNVVENAVSTNADNNMMSNAPSNLGTNLVARTDRDRTKAGDYRPRRPPWLRGMSEEDYQTLLEKRSLHGLVMALSIESFQAVSAHDLWLRTIIVLLATISVLGSGFAWRTLAKSAELQIRLVRASELTTHLKEMNLAAAGLAHETRNPLNIIRGLAQMISKQPAIGAEIQEKSRAILDETDKVTAQLNEFINYSRPREVRRTRLALSSVVNEVIRTLNYDLEEKKIRVQVLGEPVQIEADEQLLRQALFNLLLNAVQAGDTGGEIQVVAEKSGATEARLDVRDNGPGVPADRRTEIFKPYFTTQKRGTGLGLAVVQQIVLAHGWEIECLPRESKGAIFRITHLKLAA